jgi:3-oxoacyl-[acyl-carrier protein] reductase
MEPITPNTVTKHNAIVTGAAKGLGRAIAHRLWASGWRVALADIDGVQARREAAAWDATGEQVCALQLDVTRVADFHAALADLRSRWGAPHLAVHCAALTQAESVWDITPEAFDRVMQVNLRGVFLGCQVFGAAMAQVGYGRIVNIASLAGQNGGTATGAHYAASKAGIVALTKVFARELANQGVTVNAIAPGPLDLPSLHALLPPEKLATFLQQVPVGVLGEPDFVAELVLLLASPQAAFATGATWDFNGGLWMR